MCKKFTHISIGSLWYGSKFLGKRCGSPYINTSLAEEDGTINTSTYILYSGKVQYYFQHSFTTSSHETVSVTFAVVQWYNATSTNNKSYLRPLIEFSSSNLMPGGPTLFTPIQRIASLIAVGMNHSLKPSNPLENVGIPLLMPYTLSNYIMN